jgi:hypothetical protein
MTVRHRPDGVTAAPPTRFVGPAASPRLRDLEFLGGGPQGNATGGGHSPEGCGWPDSTRPQLPSKAGLCLAANAAKARPKSLVIMQSACACASDSIISSIPIAHSWLIIALVMP